MEQGGRDGAHGAYTYLGIKIATTGRPQGYPPRPERG